MYHQWDGGNAACRFWSRLHQIYGCHGNRKLPLTYKWENDVSILTPSVLIRTFIYIPQYDKHVNRKFMFMNAGISITSNVWEMSIYKLSRNINRLYIPEFPLRRAEKEATKWMKNELYDLKSNSCHVTRWCILLVKYIYACFTMTLAKEWAPSTSKLHRRLAQEQCG